MNANRKSDEFVVPVEYSPKSDPFVMRVLTAQMGKEILDEEMKQAAYAGADDSQAA